MKISMTKEEEIAFPLERVVRMVFEERYIDSFLELFEEVSPEIRNQPGCLYLALWQDRMDSRVLYTYSRWTNANALEKYRGSDLFERTWKETKSMFADKPQAWSMNELKKLP